jgi:hypothetical protein
VIRTLLAARHLFGPLTSVLGSRQKIIVPYCAGIWFIRFFLCIFDRGFLTSSIQHKKEIKSLSRFVFCHWAKKPPNEKQWTEFYSELLLLLILHEGADDPAGQLARSIGNQLESLWVFLYENGVEPTNNRSERVLRFCVPWRKRSHGTQSEKGKRTGKGNTWTLSRVRSFRNDHGIEVYQKVERESRGEINLKETARELQVSPTKVYRLIKEQILPAKQVCPAAPWTFAEKILNLQKYKKLSKVIFQKRWGKNNYCYIYNNIERCVLCC